MRRAVPSVIVATTAGMLLLAACVGDDPAPFVGPSASSGSTSSGSTSSGSTSSGSTSSGSTSSGSTSSGSLGDSGSSSDSGSASDSGGSSDAEADADAPPLGPPDPTCSTATLAPGAFYTTCLANAPAITPSAVAIPDGSYLLSSKWGCNGQNKVIGSATIFTEGGKQFMRFYRLNKAGVSDPTGTLTTGTVWLDASNGAVTTNERCDGATKNTVENGSYQMNTVSLPQRLTLLFATHAETWDKQ